MKKFFAKITSRKFLLTAGSIAYGAYLVRTGNVTEGVTIITGGLGTYNIGQGMADSKQGVAALEAIPAVLEDRIFKA